LIIQYHIRTIWSNHAPVFYLTLFMKIFPGIALTTKFLTRRKRLSGAWPMIN